MKRKKSVFRLIRLRLHNFWLFEDVDLDFSELGKTGVIFVEGVNHDATDAKSNWTGKTTMMLDSFEWIVNGRYPRLQGVSDVVGIFDKWTMGSLTYRYGKSNVVMTRYRNHPKYKNQLLVSWGGKNVSGERVIESREMFAKIVEMDVDRFAHGVLFGMDKSNLFERTPATRNKLLSTVWGLEQFDRAASICGKVCSEHDKRLAALKGKHDGKVNLLDEVNDTISMLETAKHNFKSELRVRLDKLQQKQEDIEYAVNKRTKLEHDLLKKRRQRKRVKEGIVELKRKMLQSSAVTHKLSKRRAAVAGIREAMQNNQVTIDIFKQEIDSAMSDNVGIMCDECGNIVTKKSKRRLIKGKQGRLVKLRKRNADLLTRIKGIKVKIAELLTELTNYNVDKLNDSISTMTDRIIKINEDMAELRSLLNGIDDMETSLVDLNLEITELRASKNPYGVELKKRYGQRSTIESEVESVQDTITKYTLEFNAYLYWKSSFKILRNLILTERVDSFSSEFQGQLDSLTDGSISGKWLVMAGTGDIVCELYDAMSKSKKHYRGFSSAQRSKLNLAVDIAMAKLCAPNIGHMNIDEKADNNIDDVGFRKVIEHLATDSGLGKQVFLISHNNIAASMCSAIIRIERRGNRATAKLIV